MNPVKRSSVNLNTHLMDLTDEHERKRRSARQRTDVIADVTANAESSIVNIKENSEFYAEMSRDDDGAADSKTRARKNSKYTKIHDDNDFEDTEKRALSGTNGNKTRAHKDNKDDRARTHYKAKDTETRVHDPKDNKTLAHNDSQDTETRAHYVFENTKTRDADDTDYNAMHNRVYYDRLGLRNDRGGLSAFGEYNEPDVKFEEDNFLRRNKPSRHKRSSKSGLIIIINSLAKVIRTNNNISSDYLGLA